MEKFNKYTLSFLAVFMFLGLSADNPGDDIAVDEIVEDQQVEQTITEETVEENEAVSEDEDVVTLEKVVVTGSKIKRVQQEGALPLLVITKDDIDNSGFRNVTEALQSIPSANQYTQNESIVNSFTPNANELDLRNLGPGRILFLVNGRRTADYPIPYNNAGNIVNISTIPSGLVDRIEVLGQGASAIYGSDAVSGVVNVITTKGKDFSELDVDLIEIEADKSQQASLTFTTGGFFGSSSWTFGIDHTQVDPMYYEGRDGYNSFTDAPTYGESYTNAPIGMYMSSGRAVNPETGQGYYGQKAFYGSQEFGIPCSSIDPSYFDFNKQDPEWKYTGSYPGHYCGYDYGSDRFGGNSQTIGNERTDTTVMATFNHTFDIGVNLEARVYRYEDEAYYRSDVNRGVYLTNFLDPERVQDLTRTSLGANQYVPELGCQYGYTKNGQLYCGDFRQMDDFYREFSSDLAPLAESRVDVEEELSDYFIGLSGITESGYEWTLGVNRTEYDYFNASQEFTTAIEDYFYGLGATDANGDLLVGSYFAWYYEHSPEATGFATYNEWATDNNDYIDYIDSLYGTGAATYFLGLTPKPLDRPCGTTISVYNTCFLWDRLSGDVTNDMLASWLADDSLTAYSDQQTIDFTLTGEFELAGKFIGFAVSADSQRQSYKLTPSANRLDPNIEFIQGSTIQGDGKRSRESLGVEFSIPVTSKLEANLATRYDSYDDASSNVGSRRSSMVSFAYRPNDVLLVRGSGSQSFRAPDMNYLFQKPSTGFYNGIIDYVACYAYRYNETTGITDYITAECGSFAGSVEAFSSGNLELEEEEGENYALGLVWEINENTTFYVDAYEVFLEQAVTRESPYTILFSSGYCLYGESFTDFLGFENFPERDCDDALSKIGRGNPVDALSGDELPIGDWETVSPTFMNQSYLEYRGIDWSLDYNLETANYGDFYLGIASSHILKSATKFDALADETDYLDAYTYEPRSQQNVSISWVYEDWAATLFADRLGHMEIDDGGKTDPHIITNLSVSYDFNPDIDVYLSIRNLENKMPQKDDDFGFPYYNQNYFSALGRYVAVGLNYRF